MKDGKAAGYDRVSSDMLRGGGVRVTNLLHRFLINAEKAVGYLINGAKPSLYPTIKKRLEVNLHKLSFRNLFSSAPSLLHQISLSFVRYRISTQETGNVLLNALESRVSLGSGHYL
ncbi:hypothetical protein EVAR_16394_1 [Eumeta japonica]|uniref:Uncharacterized protein n=1 Tax=Eumeta variegata TaxID=151549 RepID=A0A4C1VT59_EUMVA|nr:hypothetical protein EVAR_16394_1 [Eumeta japonica]